VDQGFVRVSPTLERSNGIYVAFTQPGKLRLTVDDSGANVPNGANTRQVQDNGVGWGPLAGLFQNPTLYFDQAVGDVTVTTAASDGAGATVTVLTQTADVTGRPTVRAPTR
jgi:hypothetical protein